MGGGGECVGAGSGLETRPTRPDLRDPTYNDKGEIMDEAAEKLSRDPRFLKAMKGLCPSGKDGIDSITITVRGHEPLVLTAEPRKTVNGLLKKAKGDATEA